MYKIVLILFMMFSINILYAKDMKKEIDPKRLSNQAFSFTKEPIHFARGVSSIPEDCAWFLTRQKNGKHIKVYGAYKYKNRYIIVFIDYKKDLTGDEEKDQIRRFYFLVSDEDRHSRVIKIVKDYKKHFMDEEKFSNHFKTNYKKEHQSDYSVSMTNLCRDGVICNTSVGYWLEKNIDYGAPYYKIGVELQKVVEEKMTAVKKDMDALNNLLNQ